MWVFDANKQLKKIDLQAFYWLGKTKCVYLKEMLFQKRLAGFANWIHQTASGLHKNTGSHANWNTAADLRGNGTPPSVKQQLTCIFTLFCWVGNIRPLFVGLYGSTKNKQLFEWVVFNCETSGIAEQHRSVLWQLVCCCCCVDLDGFCFTPGFMWWHLLNRQEPRVFCSRPLQCLEQCQALEPIKHSGQSV